MKFINIISQIRKAALVVALIFICGISTASATDITLSGSESYTAQDGDVLTGSTSGTVTIANNAKITLSDATITGGIVCAGTAEITLVGTNSVSNAWYSSAGIQIGGSVTTLTIKGNGSLTAKGGSTAAGIGLGRAWDANATGGSIVIEDGTITAIGDIGIGIGTVGNSKTASLDGIIIKGGTVNASLGSGYLYYGSSVTISTITIYDDIEKVDASKITTSVTYMHVENETETNVTASASTYFTIIEDGDRRVIEPKDDTDYTITIADGIEHGSIAYAATTAKYGEKITITATPNFGYSLSRLVVKDAQNNDVASTGNSFFMPKSHVTVSAVFEQGTHGTTEFTWEEDPGYGPESVVEKTIYNGVTTENLQQGRTYQIRTADYDYLSIDNDEYDVYIYIPYSGGTGTFMTVGTNFALSDDATAGFYDITMTDAGNGRWNVSILKTAGQMDVVPDQTYTGSEIKPEPLVMAGSLNLTKGTDYEYSYTDNVNVGTAKVTVTFKGDYASLGSVEKEFNIVPKVTELGALTLTEDQNGIIAEINGSYTDNETSSLAEDISVKSITFDRTFQQGVTSTIILPFAIESGKYSGGTFYEFQSVDYEDNKWVASMTKVSGDIEAQKPYFFVPSSDKLTIDGGVTLKASSLAEYADTKGDWTFKGVFKVKMWTTGAKTDYFFASTAATSTNGESINAGDFVRIGKKCGLNPFRCYLSYSGNDASLLKANEQLPSNIEVRLIDNVASVVEPNENPSDNNNNDDITTPVSEIIPNSGTKVWSFDKMIFIESKSGLGYQIVDLSGRILKTGVTNSTREEITLGRTVGIVIVKIGGKTFKVNY